MSPRKTHAYRPLSLKRRVWLTVGSVLLGSAGVVAVAVANPSDDPGQTAKARKGGVHALALKAAGSGERELPRTDTGPFSMLGFSWKGVKAQIEGKAQVRTRSSETGEWSGWQTLEANDALPEEIEAGMRGSSEPLWVGPSDAVEARVVADNGTETGGLPEGLRLNLVDPGVTAKEAKAANADPQPAAFAVDALASTTVAATSTATGPVSTAPEPTIVSRAGWGADESLSPDPSEYNADVKAVFVHHTAGSNDYTCAESAAVVRATYRYHTQPLPNGNGWNDIGYNFLVDKCGTIFEGRKGGADMPVLGAHTYGFNRESTGIAVLGNYTTAAPSKAALASVAKIAAWKLGQYGADPAGTVELTAGATQKNYFETPFTAGTKYTFNRISGHRDGYATECPGDLLYAKLPTIRTWAAGPVQGLALTSVSGATVSGSTYYTKGAITVNWSATTPASLISKFELLVDGQVAATAAASATSAKATLALGSHKVRVRAVHQSGKTNMTSELAFAAETTAPTFKTTPRISARAGTVNTTAVPVTLSWSATDNAALKQVNLLAPKTATYGPTTTSASHTAKSGTATTWSMRAYDYAGNYSTSSPAFTPVILQETSAVKSGTWTSKSSTSYLGGKSYSSGSKGAALTWTFTGRSAAWVVSRASGSGQAYVYVDGVKVSTVDLKSATTKYRQAIWTKSWSSSAKHTVKIVVVGTSGRPTITTDGLVYIK